MLRITQLSGEELTSLPLTELSDVKALKQRLHQEHGLPPRFRQRLLHEGQTLDDAAKLETEMDLQLLIVAFSESSEIQRRELNAAAWFGRVAKVEALLQLPMDPDDADFGYGVTPLMRASRNGHEQVARLLLEAGAEKDAIDSDGSTALMGATSYGFAEVAQLLLDAGAQTDLCDLEGRTALMTAAGYGHPSVVQLLLEARAQTDFCDTSGNTALILAATGGRNPVVRLLVEARLPKKAISRKGRQAGRDVSRASKTFQAPPRPLPQSFREAPERLAETSRQTATRPHPGSTAKREASLRFWAQPPTGELRGR